MIVPSAASKTMWHATIRLITEDVGLLAMSAPETFQGFPNCFVNQLPVKLAAMKFPGGVKNIYSVDLAWSGSEAFL